MQKYTFSLYGINKSQHFYDERKVFGVILQSMRLRKKADCPACRGFTAYVRYGAGGRKTRGGGGERACQGVYVRAEMKKTRRAAFRFDVRQASQTGYLALANSIKKGRFYVSFHSCLRYLQTPAPLVAKSNGRWGALHAREERDGGLQEENESKRGGAAQAGGGSAIDGWGRRLDLRLYRR